MSDTLDKMKRLVALGLPQKYLLPVLEIIEGAESLPTKVGRRKRRKRRTKEQMARDAAREVAKRKRAAKKKTPE